MNGITGLGHLALKVKNLEAALDFYRDRLGLQEMHRLKHENGVTWLVYLRITDTQYLELFPGLEDNVAAPEEANGVNHLCLTVNNIEAVAARLSSVGITLTSPIQSGLDGNRGAWIQDPDQNRIELMEMNPHCIQYQAIADLRNEMRY